MRWGLLICVTVLAGCSVSATPDNTPEAQNVGSYELVPAKQAEGVYVMDTTDGSIRFCRPQHPQEGMGCGPAASQ